MDSWSLLSDLRPDDGDWRRVHFLNPSEKRVEPGLGGMNRAVMAIQQLRVLAASGRLLNSGIVKACDAVAMFETVILVQGVLRHAPGPGGGCPLHERPLSRREYCKYPCNDLSNPFCVILPCCGSPSDKRGKGKKRNVATISLFLRRADDNRGEYVNAPGASRNILLVFLRSRRHSPVFNRGIAGAGGETYFYIIPTKKWDGGETMFLSRDMAIAGFFALLSLKGKDQVRCK